MTRFLATLLTHGPKLYLSEAGTWLPRSAFEHDSPQRVRMFIHAESAKGVAEVWAAKTGTTASVEPCPA